jgi:predicted metallo-beta-lactamase superfamily hydrolase
MSFYDKKLSVDEILRKLGDTSNDINVGRSFLAKKLQEELLVEQRKHRTEFIKMHNEYNRKQLCWARWLTFGTWALVIAMVLSIIIK